MSENTELTIKQREQLLENALSKLRIRAVIVKRSEENKKNNVSTNMRKKKRNLVSRVMKQEFFESYCWAKIRIIMLHNFPKQCMCCGDRPPKTIIQVDHIHPISTHWEMRDDFNNLQILCKKCNKGKSNDIIVDFRTDSQKLIASKLSIKKYKKKKNKPTKVILRKRPK